MLPAARVSDKTTHGGFIEAGAGTVQINGQAAARMSDHHTCPITQPWHVGGAVSIGGAGLALTVFIERKPAALAGSTTPCTLGPVKVPQNNVVAGSPNVFFTPSLTIAGMPISIGDDGSIRVGNALVIVGSLAYQADVLADLAKIASTDIGRKKLARLDASGKKVTIVFADLGNDGKTGKRDDKHGYPVSLGGSGQGTDTLLEYTPEHHPPASRRGTKTGMESDIVLFHELIHAEHAAYGDLDDRTRDPAWNKKWTNEEEYKTIIRDENVYRRQRGKPDRPSHDVY